MYFQCTVRISPQTNPVHASGRWCHYTTWSGAPPVRWWYTVILCTLTFGNRFWTYNDLGMFRGIEEVVPGKWLAPKCRQILSHVSQHNGTNGSHLDCQCCWRPIARVRESQVNRRHPWQSTEFGDHVNLVAKACIYHIWALEHKRNFFTTNVAQTLACRSLHLNLITATQSFTVRWRNMLQFCNE